MEYYSELLETLFSKAFLGCNEEKKLSVEDYLSFLN
jgi:hypothetical protein